MSNRLLIVEDEVAVAQEVAHFFQEKDYQVKQCFTPEDGLAAFDRDGFDLVLLGLGLPRREGPNVLQQLRRRGRLPVVVLAQPAFAEWQVRCLESGADDFLLKPVAMDQLFARVAAIFRRMAWSVSACDTCGKTLVADDLTLSRSERKAFYSGTEISLTPIQFRLLSVLVENRNEILSKPYLYKVVLERAFSRYDRSLDMHLSRVRRKLVNCGMTPERFSTIHGKGYRFA